MIEMKPVGENGQQEFPATQINVKSEEEQQYLKRKRLFIIVGAVTISLTILIVVLCLCLIGNSKEDENSVSSDSSGSEKDPISPKDLDVIQNNIILEVYSESNNKDIAFLSEEYIIQTQTLRKMDENRGLIVDGEKYAFSKSLKLKQGKHKVTIVFNGKINSCQNMFKNCEDIQSIYFNATNECNNMDNMFSGCSSLTSINISNLNSSEVIIF